VGRVGAKVKEKPSPLAWNSTLPSVERRAEWVYRWGMFQTFDTLSSPVHGQSRVAGLRAALKALGLDGFIVPHADEHQNEYLPPSAQRLTWLTGFTGSAGAAIVTADRAVIFVDGRYTLQVRDQVDMAVFETAHFNDHPPADWLKANVTPGQVIGFDPWMHTRGQAKKLDEAVTAAGGRLVPVEPNPIDGLWTDRPAPPLAPIVEQPLALAGEAAADKIARIATAIGAAKADAALLVQADAIAWLYNIRGGDTAHTPLPLAFSLVPAAGRPTLFVDGRKLSNQERARLEDLAQVREPSDLLTALGQCGGQRVLIDSAFVAEKLAATLTAAGATLVETTDPVSLPRARKNAAEIAGARAAHVRDGAAMARFLAWFDSEAPKGHLDEIAVATALEGFRMATGALKDLSFDTISGAGPNGAIVHYRVTRDTNRPVDQNSLFLIDSGGQYQDGTTDVTRTLVVGTPTDEMRDRFTRVLKGMIALSRVRFPKGTTGAHLDILARHALWTAGLDYDHGTGHGVGSYLGVHEGPQRISKTGHVALEPGMFLSNEPGYYKTGAFGIRIENLVIVTEPTPIEGGERPMMAFETLTLVPIDRRGLVLDLLTPDEIAWLDAYHARVRTEIGPLLSGPDADWLAAATRPLRETT
jgi:Xaa-Pro aminopeptidase